ncbi:chromosome loss-related protein [Diaporthe australafricana]|uniref:Chromosome loss-related protein n=1 Tax=Diaporthe australafricana TaxID=127596 RepID=A0ABR3W2R0_9PEZI
MARISVPTTARLPSTLRLDSSSPTVLKHLNRLTRLSLLALVLDWLDHDNAPICAPYLREPQADHEDDDPADLYSPLSTLEELRDLYSDMQTRKGSKREVVDRIAEGDWRHGLTLYQVSMADLQHLYQNPTSQKWSAYHVVPLKTPTPQQAAEDDGPLKVDAASLAVPRFHPSTFIQNLQAQVLPDVKAHYSFDRPKDMALLLLRIFIIDSPYNTKLATSPVDGDTSRTIYVAFPDGSPYVYISKPQTIGSATSSETKSLHALIIEGIPKALSRPRQRYTLKSTALNTRNIQELLHRRGPGRTNSAGGGWSIYTDDKKKESPLGTLLPSPPLSEVDDGAPTKDPGQGQPSKKRAVSPDTARDERRVKRASLIAQARFGDSARIDDGRGVERVDIVIDDPFRTAPIHNDGEAAEREPNSPQGGPREVPARRSIMDVAFDRAREQDDEDGGGGYHDDDGEEWRPSVKLTFHGPHVFAGVRQLVEAGIIDGERMPGWLTGEDGVTIGAVRHGRIRGHKGSGL